MLSGPAIARGRQGNSMRAERTQRMALLLVDDEPALANALARSLTVRGHVVETAGSHAAAMEAVGKTAFDLFLIDINLPDASGWDVLRDIAAAGVSTPAVVFSAVPPSTQRVREFQPYGVLVKPFPIDALVRLVDQVEKEKFGE